MGLIGFLHFDTNYGGLWGFLAELKRILNFKVLLNFVDYGFVQRDWHRVKDLHEWVQTIDIVDS